MHGKVECVAGAGEVLRKLGPDELERLGFEMGNAVEHRGALVSVEVEADEVDAPDAAPAETRPASAPRRRPVGRRAPARGV